MYIHVVNMNNTDYDMLRGQATGTFTITHKLVKVVGQKEKETS